MSARARATTIGIASTEHTVVSDSYVYQVQRDLVLFTLSHVTRGRGRIILLHQAAQPYTRCRILPGSLCEIPATRLCCCGKVITLTTSNIHLGHV